MFLYNKIFQLHQIKKWSIFHEVKQKWNLERDAEDELKLKENIGRKENNKTKKH